jgi:ABC-type nitrate/sulfonate/bicarbonate transport system ATPase subunit
MTSTTGSVVPGHRPPSPSAARTDGAVVLDSVAYAHRPRRGDAVAAVDGLTLHAAPGEVVALVGPSGCGKSTLLDLVCGLLEPDSGTVDAPPAVLMPQRDLLLPWLTALDNAALAPRLAGSSRETARASARPLFERFGLGGFEGARPDELSGGMRQRVAFLRTLLSGRPVLCLDEPFASLDALTREELGRWLAAALASEPRTVLFVTHDVEEAAVLADRVLVLSPRPARVVAEITVGGTRPRSGTDAAVVEARRAALEGLR